MQTSSTMHSFEVSNGRTGGKGESFTVLDGNAGTSRTGFSGGNGAGAAGKGDSFSPSDGDADASCTGFSGGSVGRESRQRGLDGGRLGSGSIREGDGRFGHVRIGRHRLAGRARCSRQQRVEGRELRAHGSSGGVGADDGRFCRVRIGRRRLAEGVHCGCRRCVEGPNLSTQRNDAAGRIRVCDRRCGILDGGRIEAEPESARTNKSDRSA